VIGEERVESELARLGRKGRAIRRVLDRPMESEARVDDAGAEFFFEVCVARGNVCAEENGGCDGCPLLQLCNLLWDANVWHPYRLGPIMEEVYKARRQMT